MVLQRKRRSLLWLLIDVVLMMVVKDQGDSHLEQMLDHEQFVMAKLQNRCYCWMSMMMLTIAVNQMTRKKRDLFLMAFLHLHSPFSPLLNGTISMMKGDHRHLH